MRELKEQRFRPKEVESTQGRVRAGLAGKRIGKERPSNEEVDN